MRPAALVLLSLALPFLSTPALAQYGSTGFGGFAPTPVSAPASADLMARAYSGVALQDAGPSSFLLNPAHIATVRPGVSGSLSLLKPDYLIFNRLSDTGVSTQNLAFGVQRSAWRLGAGLSRTHFALGEIGDQIQTDNQGNEIGARDGGPVSESSYVLGIGAAYTGRLSLAAGLAARRTVSAAPYFEDDPAAWSADLGFSTGFEAIEARAEGGPFLRLGAGYALQHAGGAAEGSAFGILVTDDPVSADVQFPLTRMARLGWSATLGYDGAFRSRPVRLVQIDLALDTSHPVTRFGVENGRFVATSNSVFGQIRPLDALLGRGRAPEGDNLYDEPTGDGPDLPAVTGHRSVRVSLLDAVHATLGMHSDPTQGPDGHTALTFGGGISASGLIQSHLFGPPSPGLQRLADRADLTLLFARYGIYGEDDNYAFEGDVAQPWTLGATLSVAWP